jgi:hypothetical protein
MCAHHFLYHIFFTYIFCNLQQRFTWHLIVFREIQNKTNTRIHFKEELETDTHKVLNIRGKENLYGTCSGSAQL